MNVTDQQVIYVLAAVASVAVAGLVAMTVRHALRRRREEAQRAQAKADVAEMSILFQTMREIIAQQKALAKDFNAELDKKLALVRQTVAKATEQNQALQLKQQQLAQELEEARTQAQALQRELAARPAAEFVPADAPSAVPPPAEEPTAGWYVQDLDPAAPGAAEVLTQESFSKWIGIDLGPEEPAPPPAPPVPPPDSPEDATAARDAFRALLNVPSEEQAPPPPPAAAAEPRPSGMQIHGSLQQRVVEYSDAGMTVNDIARELGIGKGEVRLMLSLARQSRG